MKQITVTILIMAVLGTNSKAQQLNYSATESAAIHDSISKSRWDIGGSLSHYSFRFMSEFFPTSVIEKPATTFAFKEQPLKAIEEIKVKSGGKEIGLDAHIQAKHINSIIVLHKGTIVFEKYYGMYPMEQHTLQSVTKVLTSTLIAHLVNQQKIDIEQPIERYIPELAKTEWAGIPVKNILHMRSGMKGSETSENMGGFTNPKHPYYAFEEALGVLPQVDTLANSVYDYVGTMKRKVPVNNEPEYNSMNTFILGWLAEKITGKKYSDLISEIIWKPMGASSHAYVCVSNKGVPWMHGGISATLRDLARFGMLYTHSEIKARKESIVSFKQLKEIFATPVIDKGFEKFNWGYQWDVARDGMIMKGGFGGQALLVFPEKDIVIAYFNYVDKNWMDMKMLSSGAVKAIIHAIE